MILANVIGLTESTCECLGLPEGDSFDTLNTSESGLYLTDQDGGFPMLDRVLASIDCNSPNNVLDVMVKARSSAVSSFTNDVSATLMSKRKAPHLFRGNIGRTIAKPVFTIPTGATSLGVEIVLPVRRGQTLVIDKIFTGFGSDLTLNLTVWSNDPTFTPPTIEPITVTGGSVGTETLSSPIVLPQYSDAMANERRIIYRFYYTPTVAPYKLELTCCGQSANYSKFFWTRGFVDRDGSVTSNNDSTIGSYSSSMGLAFSGYQSCDVTEWLCETEELGGYDLKTMIAKSIRYQGAINLIHYVLKSGRINAFTLLGREDLYGLRNAYASRYAENVKWISENVPDTASDCLGCKKKVVELATVPL